MKPRSSLLVLVAAALPVICRAGSGLEPSGTPPSIEPAPGTDGPLAVVQALPTGRASGVIRPTITFSRPIVALGNVETGETQPAPAAIEPEIAGEWRWLGSASVQFAPRGPWPYGTRFTVTVAAGLTALDGSRLERPYTFSFETPRPLAKEVAPRPGSPWLTPAQRFAITFDRPVADVARHVELKVGDEVWPLVLAKETPLADRATQWAASPARGRPPGEFYATEELGLREMRYELAPGRPLPLDASITLSLDASLESMTDRSPWLFRTYGQCRSLSDRHCP